MRVDRAVAGLCLVVAVGASVFAAGPGSGTALIPYQGTIEFNGAPISGQHDLKFTLYPDLASTTPLWTEEQSAVEVANGAFAVTLGSATPMDNALFTQNDLELQVSVRPVGSSTYADLSGRQRLLPAAYAQRADMAVNPYVYGVLTMTGADLRITHAASGAGGRALTHDVGNTLAVNSGGDFTSVRVDGTGMNVGGTLGVGGALTAASLTTAGALRFGTTLGSWSPRNLDSSYTEATDGFVVAVLHVIANGDRGYLAGSVDGIVYTRASVHYFTNSDVYVGDAMLFMPVQKGHAWQVAKTNTSGVPGALAYFVPMGG